MNKKPNILFLMSDQHRYDYLGSVNPIIKTPTLDALAAEGIRFSETVCNVPMCVPSRYSMMSGLYGCQIGVKHNAQMITNDANLPVKMMAQHLADAGYQTAGIGKTHWYIGSAVMPNVKVSGSKRGFEIRAIQEKSIDPNKNEIGSVYMGDEEPDWFEQVCQQTVKDGPGGESVNGYVGSTSLIPPEHHFEGWLTRQALFFFENQRDNVKPFFLFFSLDFPHVGLNVPKEFEDLYDINDFKEEKMPISNFIGHRPTDRFAEIWQNMTPEQHSRSKLRYAALCTYVDHCFGQVINKLKEKGEFENTFILFTSDHGDMLGDRGRVSKYCLYEGSIRVPMIISGQGVAKKGVVDPRPTELIDVVPTFLQVAGVEIPGYLPGISLLSDFIRSGSFAEMHGRGYEEYQRAPAIMWRTNTWKLILYMPGKLGEACHRYDQLNGELYSLVEDPLELNNRYADASCAQIREQLTAHALMHVMSSLGRYPSEPARPKITIEGPETKPDSSIWK